jgi:predicted enzyme related to lactoylglutathione lyase
VKIQGIYPLFTVHSLSMSREFFVRHFKLDVLFEADWVVMFGLSGSASPVLGLMSADHPSAPPGPETFKGQGMIVTIQVEDAARAYADLSAEGARMHHRLQDEPWGQRRFMTVDPSGILIDVVEQIEPAPGFWDRYLK